MIAKSTCQLCSRKIEFETDHFQPGMTTVCPNCGMETVLFILPGIQRQAAPVENDGCIYKSGRVTVTPSLLTVGLSTFPIAAISSFRVMAFPPNPKNIKRLTLFAIMALAFGLFVLALNAAADKSSVGALLFGWLLILIGGLALAVLVFAKANTKFGCKLIGKPTYGLNITTSAREQTAITSPEIETVQAIDKALRQAVSKRG